MFARVNKALSSKSMLATRSGGIRFRMYSCAEEIRRRLGSFQIIEPELSMANMTSWLTWVTVAWNSFGTYLNEIWMEVVLAGSKRRLPCRAVEKGETRSEEHTSELQSPCNLVCR